MIESIPENGSMAIQGASLEENTHQIFYKDKFKRKFFNAAINIFVAPFVLVFLSVFIMFDAGPPEEFISTIFTISSSLAGLLFLTYVYLGIKYNTRKLVYTNNLIDNGVAQDTISADSSESTVFWAILLTESTFVVAGAAMSFIIINGLKPDYGNYFLGVIVSGILIFNFIYLWRTNVLLFKSKGVSQCLLRTALLPITLLIIGTSLSFYLFTYLHTRTLAETAKKIENASQQETDRYKNWLNNSSAKNNTGFATEEELINSIYLFATGATEYKTLEPHFSPEGAYEFDGISRIKEYSTWKKLMLSSRFPDWDKKMYIYQKNKKLPSKTSETNSNATTSKTVSIYINLRGKTFNIIEFLYTQEDKEWFIINYMMLGMDLNDLYQVGNKTM